MAVKPAPQFCQMVIALCNTETAGRDIKVCVRSLVESEFMGVGIEFFPAQIELAYFAEYRIY